MINPVEDIVDEAIVDEAIVDEAIVDEAIVDEAIVDDSMLDNIYFSLSLSPACFRFPNYLLFLENKEKNFLLYTLFYLTRKHLFSFNRS
jgi:hypothetical protein